MKPTTRVHEQKPFRFYLRDARLFLIFSVKSEIRIGLSGNSPAKRNPMRLIGPHSSALSAATAWSSERPGDGRVVRAAEAGFPSSNEPTQPGLGQPD
jgi:hypothetical protein